MQACAALASLSVDDDVARQLVSQGAPDLVVRDHILHVCKMHYNLIVSQTRTLATHVNDARVAESASVLLANLVQH